LKELKECKIALKIISIRKMVQPVGSIDQDRNETEQLIAIIGKSISTAERNTKEKSGSSEHLSN
jgi:hypothetical protein